MVRIALFFCFIVATNLFGQEKNTFFLAQGYDYKNLEALETMQRQFLPKETTIWGNNTVQYQQLNFGFVDVIRKATIGQDSILHFVNVFGKKLKYYKSYAPDTSFSYVPTKKTEKLDALTTQLVVGFKNGKKFPVYMLSGFQPLFFPRFSSLNGIPVQYKLVGMDTEMDVFVFVKKLSNTIPNEYKLTDPEGYTLSTEKQVQEMFGGFK